MSSSVTPGPSLTGDPRRRRRESIIGRLLFAAAAFSVLVSLAIVLSLIGNAADFLTKIDLGTLWSSGWLPRRGEFDVRTIVVASIVVSTIALLVAGPLGLMAAVYLSEYASPRVRRSVKPILEVLAGIPSVVLGFFALTWINPNVTQRIFSTAGGFNMLTAGIGVGILVLPLMASVSEDALRSVPRSLREASYGLGARKRLTTLRVVLPAAVSGIVAAAIITISRAIGETMVVTIAGGSRGDFAWSPIDSSPTMTAAIANLATGSDNVVGDVAAVDSLYFVGILLFAFTLGLNVLGDRIVRRHRKAY
ncbi:MAG: phosphate ABC transporter permease subunit PstC [Actinobacteria bacterium]|nr:phosphate ABC transporter permease subunit PstC [Actinomycetota bacterium]